MADILQMSQDQLDEEILRLQERRNTWLELSATEEGGGSSDLPDFSVAESFPDTPEGIRNRAAYSRRFNNSLNKLKDKSNFGIPGYISTEIYANVKDQREEIKKKNENNIEKKTFLDLPIGEIIKNTVMFLVNFQKNMNYHIYKVELEERINDTNEKDIPFINLKRFMLAFFHLLNEGDNILYFGFILLFLSIILYLFNILRG